MAKILRVIEKIECRHKDDQQIFFRSKRAPKIHCCCGNFFINPLENCLPFSFIEKIQFALLFAKKLLKKYIFNHNKINNKSIFHCFSAKPKQTLDEKEFFLTNLLKVFENFPTIKLNICFIILNKT